MGATGARASLGLSVLTFSARHRPADASQFVGEAAQCLLGLGAAAKADSEPGSWSGLLVVY